MFACPIFMLVRGKCNGAAQNSNAGVDRKMLVRGISQGRKGEGKGRGRVILSILALSVKSKCGKRAFKRERERAMCMFVLFKSTSVCAEKSDSARNNRWCAESKSTIFPVGAWRVWGNFSSLLQFIKTILNDHKNIIFIISRSRLTKNVY